MKGKETISDKALSLNVADWKDHKWFTTAFFYHYQKSFKLSDEIPKVYGKFADYPAIVTKNIDILVEGSNEYTKLHESIKEEINDIGKAVQDQYLSNGLTIQEVEKRREIDGPNSMPEKKKTHWTLKLLKEFTTLFSILLWFGGALAIIMYGLSPSDHSNLWLAIVLWGIVIVSGLLSFWYNSKSENIIESFKSFQNEVATIVRNGVKRDVNAIDLVVGDVVIFSTGKKIPADIRVFEATDLSVNNSGLTGESKPVKLTGECGKRGLDTPLESKNIAFFSTLCMSGIGKGIVIRTGKNTFMGKIAELSQMSTTEPINLEKELDHFIKIISIIALSLGLAFFLGSLGMSFPAIGAISFAIGIVVSNIPEGLLVCLTIALAFIAFKLYQKNVMVKNMGSIETLGAITCICSDKTGTLTQNKMSVVHLWYDCELRKTREFQEDIYVDGNKVKLSIFDEQDPSFKFFKFSSVCGSASNFKSEIPDEYPPLVQGINKIKGANPKISNDELFLKVQDLKKTLQPDYDKIYKTRIDDRLTDGDASEAGILKFFEKIENINVVRTKFPQHRVNNEDIKIPFNSAFKYAGSLRRAEIPEDQKDCYYWLAFKGAPDYLIKKCSHYLMNGKEYPLDSFFNRAFQQANQTFALKGERVLAVAYYKLPKFDFPKEFQFKNDTGADPNLKTPNYPIDKLCFAGLIGMEDPPREGVKDAIALCKRAGIKVIMVTGDQTLTAASIAYQIGIINDLDDTPEVIMAKEGLSNIEDAEKKSNVSRY